jgi:transposase-like protein
MDPQCQFCHNPHCPARGQRGQGNIRVLSRKERRYQCVQCWSSFAETTGTPFYRLHKPHELVVLVVTLLCHGCPIQAIVAAFGLDERTVAGWQTRAGEHCEEVHQHLVGQGRVDLQHVQADEIWVKMVGRRVWMAMAMAVPFRLWLGGAISVRRDRVLIGRVVEMVRLAAGGLAMLVCVDGLSTYVSAFLRVFRHRMHTGRRGRPRLVVESGLMIGQVVKRCVQRRVVSVSRQVVRGTAEAIEKVLKATGTGSGINTAYIERLNATFRSVLAPLVRRGRALARKETILNAGMYLVGCAYNFCWAHDSLRLAAPAGSRYKWQERTPAMAAGLTDRRWTMGELLRTQVPLPAWVPKKRRGRPPKQPQPVAVAVET